ncbi:MAG TPA: SDR family oxidoreductase [Myxococcota bacterium]|nr:SDR family oxidoreductase [Myxococcota bacterium]
MRGDWSLEDRTCLVTGATSGIGLETAVGLAREGARVLIVGRDPMRGEAARAEIARRSGHHRVELLRADLASLKEVRRLADEVRARCPALHVLVNNAGVMNLTRRQTEDGFEATFAVNHLAYFALTHHLLDLLKANAPARIVNVASDAHRFGRIDWDDLQSERRYRGLPVVAAMRVYGTSKLLNILFTQELARRLEGSGVTANCVHPGAVSTRLGANNGSATRIAASLLRPFMLSPAEGARTSIHLASSPDVAELSGRYFAKMREARCSRAARDPDAARRLWMLSAELAGLDAEAA